MRKIFCCLMLLVGAMATGGCTGTKMIGMIGDTEMWSVWDHSWDGPNMTMICSRAADGKMTALSTATSPGFFTAGGTALLGNGASAAGFATGMVFRNPDKTKVDNSNSNSASANQSQGQLQGQIQGQAQNQSQTQKSGHNHGHGHGHGNPHND
jgi:hypothetical protein